MIPALLQGTPNANEVDYSAFAGAEGPDLMRYLLVCGFLIAVIVALGFGFRKLTQGTLRGRASRRALQTVDVLPLGGKAKVAVIRCYEKSYLVGVGDKEIRLLSELDPNEIETDEAPELTTVSAVGKTAGGFLDALKERVGDVLPSAKPADSGAPEPAAALPRPARKKSVAKPKPSRSSLPGGGIVG